MNYLLILFAIFISNNFVKPEISFREPFDNLRDNLTLDKNDSQSGINNLTCYSYCVVSKESKREFCDGIICTATLQVNPVCFLVLSLIKIHIGTRTI